MRPVLTGLLSALLLLLLAVPASAHPTVALDPTLPTDLTVAATSNVEYLGRFPEHIGTAGGMRHGDRYYLTDPRGVHVYDLADPANPVRLGSLPLFQTETGQALAQEDPNTNGEILVVDGANNPFVGAALTVVDVSDPAEMSVLATLDVTDHTWTCVSAEVDGEMNGCAYVYGRTGHIVDLTTPTEPVLLGHTWRTTVGGYTGYTHDLTEIRPGLVMSAGAANILMDTRNPRVPIDLARIAGTHGFGSLGYHSVEWALEDDGSLSDLFVAGTEISPDLGGVDVLGGASAGTDCQGEESVIETFDAGAVAAAVDAYQDPTLAPAERPTLEEVRATSFTLSDTFDVSGRGIYLDGNAPANVLYCAHWMEFSPDADGDGGQIAVSYYDRGTRFLSVDGDGVMSEDAWIVPVQGYAGSVQWVEAEDGADLLYIHDYTRGMEVVRLSDAEATGTWRSEESAMSLTSTFSPAPPIHVEDWAPLAIVLLGIALTVAERRRAAARRR